MIDIQINTYWNVETLYYVFNGVAAIMGGDGFSGLLKMIFYFALVLGVFAYMGSKQIELAKWFIQALIFTTLLNMPITRVLITDKTGLEPARTVDNVPFALSIVAQTSNLTFGWLTDTYETVFGVPEEMGLKQGDLAFGHRILKNVNGVTIRDPGLRADIMQFFKECTMYDVRDGAVTQEDLVGKTGTWDVIFSNTNPARFVTYNTLTANPQTDTCTAVAEVLKERVNDGLGAAEAYYGRSQFSRASTDDIAKTMYLNAVGVGYDWILQSSAAASDSMKQSMFNNMWKDAGAELPSLLNDPASAQQMQTLTGAAMAAKQAGGSNSTISLLAQETLPHMRNWLEALIYAVFPIVVLMMVVVSADGAKKLIGGYMMSLAWIGMWPVMFALINHLSLMHLKNKLAGLKLADAGGVPFQLMDVFDATLSDEQAAIGYMVLSVPFLSAAIVKMAQGGFMSVADKMMTGFSSAGASVGAGWASGNISMGQVGMDTASVNTTTMNKLNTNTDLQSGGASVGWGNGMTGTMAANGHGSFSEARNSLLTGIRVQKQFQSDSSQEGHRSTVTGDGSQEADRSARSASLTDAYGHHDAAGRYQTSGVVAGTTASGGNGGQYSGGQSLGTNVVDSSRFNTSVGALGQGSMGLGVASRGGAPSGGMNTANPAGPGAAGKPTQAANPREEKAIVDAMKDTGATQKQINDAVAGYRSGAQVVYQDITDNYGNLIRKPVGFQNPAGQKGQDAPEAAQKAGKGGRGLPVQGSLSYTAFKNYSAEHGRGKSVDSTHGTTEDARLNTEFNRSGHRTVDAGAGQKSDQGDVHNRDASLAKVNERSTIKDVSTRNESGIGARASRSVSDSATIEKNLMEDPSFLARVAERNGMNEFRFAGQGRGRMMQMIRSYMDEKDVLSAAQTMPTTGLGGEKIPDSKADLKEDEAKALKAMPDTIEKKHKQNIGKTGFKGVKPVSVNTDEPAIVKQAEGTVRGELDKNNKKSIPARAGKMDENVTAWASPDKELGEGRAKPLAVVETQVGNDVADSAKDVKNGVLNLVDRVIGGEGKAYGPQYNENQKRTTQTPLDVKKPGDN